ncbi:hypothetical protein LX59_00950 [Azomonas agilis]|uniref:Uncharacterized protein n=1 Tax=Azomonas agilis TaxID=116849 RepID=A0A562J1Z4_9GAMM|nr:hypothetical protein [Azomonas agilis]TWH76904.1 hypothetical protein LX59_00950 [Azomonas agilis]
MDFDPMDYPEKIMISGFEFNGYRNMSKGTLLIPYTDEPDVGIGDMVTQKSGRREIELKIVDVQFLPGETGGIGTKHQNLLILKVENLSAQPHLKSSQAPTFNIGSISGDQVQVGSSNSQVVNISVQGLVDAIAKSGWR